MHWKTCLKIVSFCSQFQSHLHQKLVSKKRNMQRKKNDNGKKLTVTNIVFWTFSNFHWRLKFVGLWADLFKLCNSFSLGTYIWMSKKPLHWCNIAPLEGLFASELHRFWYTKLSYALPNMLMLPRDYAEGWRSGSRGLIPKRYAGFGLY